LRERSLDDEPPLVSVVIASVNGLPWIARSLTALVSQTAAIPCEILVVDRCGEATREGLRHGFPEIQVIGAPSVTSVPALRAMGMARASGSLVAVLSDVCRPAPGWLATAARAHEEGRQITGGAVENGAKGSGAAWAAFLCEYARFMPPLERGPVDAVPGSNAVYSRAVLEQAAETLQQEAWEFFLHRRLAEQGVELFCDPDLVVSHEKEFGWIEFLSQRYHHSRSFAGMRLRESPYWRRLAYAGLTPLLPALLLFRIGRTVARKRRFRLLFRALPALLTYLAAWAWGEAVGALGGVGRSLERVR